MIPILDRNKLKTDNLLLWYHVTTTTRIPSVTGFCFSIIKTIVFRFQWEKGFVKIYSSFDHYANFLLQKILVISVEEI